MPNEFTYSMDTDGVDWDRLKSALRRDEFDNGRTAEQLRASFETSRHSIFAWRDGKIIGTARALSDGVCNAYVVDVWTNAAWRRQGVATSMLQRLLAQLNGQHVVLMADGAEELYRKLGFVEQPGGFSQVVGRWLEGAC
jgi:predicted GNAT family acetyltransferase